MSKCEVCNEAEAKHTHHINGDRSDNRDENLLQVCPTCHGCIHGGVEGFEEYSSQLPPESMSGYRPETIPPKHQYDVVNGEVVINGGDDTIELNEHYSADMITVVDYLGTDWKNRRVRVTIEAEDEDD